MAKEAIQISPREIEGFINDSAEKRQIDLDGEKRQMISEILSTVPERMYPTTLTKWCHRKVEEVIKAHPDLIPVAEEIRSDVRKELVYLMHKDEFDDLSRAVFESKLDGVRPEDIKGLKPAFWLKILRNYSDGHGKVDWEWVARRLGFEDKFKRDLEPRASIHSAVDELVVLLESKSPDSFGPTWIDENNNPLYQYLNRKLKTNFGINWRIVVDLLPPMWQARWLQATQSFRRSRSQIKVENVGERLSEAHVRKTFEETTLELEKKLRTDNPDFFTPSYIFVHCGGIYTFFRRFVYNETGKIDWDLIISMLPSDLQNKWKRSKVRYEDHAPKRHYEDGAEVETALDPYREKLYTVVELNGSSDRDEKDKIIQALVALAKKGNDAAKTRLIEYLQYSISDWIDRGRLPAILAVHSAEVLSRVERAIYLHNQEKGFLVYLQVNLQMMAKGFRVSEVGLTGRESSGIRSDLKHNGQHIADSSGRFYDEPTDY